MSRIVILSGTGPVKFKAVDGDKDICTCGLSKNFPYCDQSHKKTLTEDVTNLYQYDEDGTREEVLTDEEEEDGCCGGNGGCCCKDGDK